MSNIIQKAKEYSKAGISVIPTTEDKRPALKEWTSYQSNIMTEEEIDRLFTGAVGIGIVCGKVSGDLEVIDVDTKHDTTGTLWEEFSSLLEDNLPETYKELIIAQTKSKGYHIYYRCEEIEGNKKLANKQNKEVLIETRGQGGYVIAPPTANYTYLQGEPVNIPTISKEERSLILKIARHFNEIEEPEFIPKKIQPTTSLNNLTSPFEAYNKSGDVIELLENKGWRVVSNRGERINLLRQGSTDSKTSGNFHTGLRKLKIFSTSTEFNSDDTYSPSDVFIMLECNGDKKLAYRRLLELGYGEAPSSFKPTQLQTKRINVTKVNKVSKVNTEVSRAGDKLKIENIKTANGEEIIITIETRGNSDLPEKAKESFNKIITRENIKEIKEAIELLRQETDQIFIREEEGVDVYFSRYLLNSFFNTFNKAVDEAGGITDRAIIGLKRDVIDLLTTLSPTDRELLRNEFLTFEGIRELGITQEALDKEVDKKNREHSEEKQLNRAIEINTKVGELLEAGELEEALKLQEKSLPEVKQISKTTEFENILNSPVDEFSIINRLSNRPDSLTSGYTIEGEEYLLQAGAMNILTAPTSHGKTTMLINLALNVLEQYPTGEVYFFSFEEDTDSILINTLNTFINEDLSRNNRKSIKHYFKSKGSLEMFNHEKREVFLRKKDQFFNELINTNRLNIHYTTHNSEALIEFIRHINKNRKPTAIFIDYIQLLNLPEGRANRLSRQEELKAIGLSIKDIAVETGLPIILGAQFNRQVNNLLKLHSTNIGEAGDIERQANTILGMWNNNLPSIISEGEAKQIKEKGGEPDTIFTKILKNRGGKVGSECNLLYNGNRGKITEIYKEMWGDKKGGGVEFR